MKKALILAFAACAALLAVSSCTPAESLSFDYDPECTVDVFNNTVTFNYVLYNSGYADLSNVIVEFSLFGLYDGLNDVSSSISSGTTNPVNIGVAGEASGTFTFYLPAPTNDYSPGCFVGVTRAAWDKDSDGIFNDTY